MIPELETERMWLRPVRLEDAEQTQKLFPQWEILKSLGAVVPWPYPPDGALTFYSRVAALLSVFLAPIQYRTRLFICPSAARGIWVG
jgi:hypothetical protein